MFAYLFIVILANMALQITNVASDCSKCQLGGYFTESNGYACFEFSDGKVACTCPDQRYTFDKSCRICSRENICGNDPKTYCTETIPSLLNVKTNDTYYYACFCADMSYNIEKPCPSIPIPTTAVPSKKE